MDENRTAGDAAIEPGASGVFRIYPGNGVPPGSEGWDWSERTSLVPWITNKRRYTRNVVIPTVTLHRPPPGKANGTTLIIAPGGAFHFLMIEHEGHEMARWLNELGVTALVMTYRLARTPDDDGEMTAFRDELRQKLDMPTRTETSPPNRAFLRPVRLLGEDDGRQAIRFVREHASEWKIDPARVGMCGFSAGGNVALGAAMEHDIASRPDFAVAVYPAYRPDMVVPDTAPPLFLTIADDDPQVAPMSSSRLYEAWHKVGAPVELHVFGNGAHGFGMTAGGHLSDIWPMLLKNWLGSRGLLPAT
jgi:acetyl esterase/lipase